MNQLDLTTADLTKHSAQDILSSQHLIPPTFYENEMSQWPSGTRVAYMPYHPYYFKYWETLTDVCRSQISTPEQLAAAFHRIHGNSDLYEHFKQYLDHIQNDSSIITPHSLNQWETFWQITLPTLQRAIINLPLEMAKSCNWSDFTVLPTLRDIKLYPNDASTLIGKENLPQQQSPGFSLNEFISELQRVITVEEELHSKPKLDSNKPRKESDKSEVIPEADQNHNDTNSSLPSPNLQPQRNSQSQSDQSSNDLHQSIEIDKSSEQNQNGTDATPLQQKYGFFFGPGLTKLILSRKAVMGLMAVGFFGLPGKTDSSQSVEFEYPGYCDPHNSTPTRFRRYPLDLSTIDNGMVSQMYKYLGTAGVMAKLQAMLSYFSYFTSNVQDPNHVATSFKNNVIGCVEYCWKLPGIQVDYVIDTILNRTKIRNDLFVNQDQDQNQAGFFQSPELLPLLDLPPSLMSTGSRRELYLSHPLLLTIPDLIKAFEPLRKLKQDQGVVSMSDIEPALSYIYQPFRYTNTTTPITSVQSNPYRRWLYGNEAMFAVYSMMASSHHLLESTWIGTTETPNGTALGTTYSSSHSINYDGYISVLNQLTKAQEDESEMSPLVTLLKSQSSLDSKTIQTDIVPNLATLLSRLTKQAGKTMNVFNEDFESLYDFDQTYPKPKPSQRPPTVHKNSTIEGQQYITAHDGTNGIGPLHTLAPDRFRIQSFHNKFLNNAILADFANKHLGGGTLRRGSVQEEMVFSEYFECCLGMGFSATMHPSATISLVGVVNHAILGGYASRSFLSQVMTLDDNQWVAELKHAQKLKDEGKLSDEEFSTQYPIPSSLFTDYTSKFPVSNILAFDSTPYGSPSDQFKLKEIQRQFTKITSGLTSTLTYADQFSASPDHPDHSNRLKPDTRLYTPTTHISGNWGCGVFGATPSWIYQLQLLVCGTMDVALRYLSVGDQRCVGAHIISLLLATYHEFATVQFMFQKMVQTVGVTRDEFFHQSSSAWGQLTKLVSSYKSSPSGSTQHGITDQARNFIQLIKESTPLYATQKTRLLQFHSETPLKKWESSWQAAFDDSSLAKLLNQHQDQPPGQHSPSQQQQQQQQPQQQQQQQQQPPQTDQLPVVSSEEKEQQPEKTKGSSLFTCCLSPDTDDE